MQRPRIVGLAVVLSLSAALATVQPNSLFTDHTVLQRGRPLTVWGTATADEPVTVKLCGQEVKTQAKDGRWQVVLRPLEAGGPFELAIVGERNTVTVADLMVGEVWVCSGQSNMAFNLRAAFEAEQDIAASADDGLRLYQVKNRSSDEDLPDADGKWQVSAPATTPGFSAVGYYFGRYLRQQLKVPVGLINSSWGGTPAEAWTSWSTLNRVPELQGFYKQYVDACAKWPGNYVRWQAALAKWREDAAAARKANQPVPRQPQMPYGPLHQSRPGALYRGMIAPLQPFGIRGAIWYQGEANAGRAYQYRTLMPAMIQDWRDGWGQGDLPFLMVQLAPFMKIVQEPAESAWAELREAQFLTTRKLPSVGMAVITDVGEENDIHPKRKAPVGERLGVAALGIAYGRKVEISGPLYDKLTVEGDRIRLRFTHTEGGLVAKGGPLTGFTICGADHKWVNAEARIDGRAVVVSSPAVRNPVAVRFGWANFPVVNLWNGAGLPASPFRTDEFAGVTAAKQ